MTCNWTPSIVPTDHDQTIYLVVNNFRHLGTAFTETDVEQANLETVITDLMSGQYSDPVRVVAFNTAEHWADDVSQDVALEIQRRVDLAGDALPSSIEAFIETHTGPSRQLPLRLNCHGIKSFLIRS
jgi:hypothetical protein